MSATKSPNRPRTDKAAHAPKTARADFEIHHQRIAPGKRQQIEIPVAKTYDHMDVTMPVEVVHGAHDGPVLFVTAAIHGDEINGVEIIRRLLGSRRINPRQLHGTLIAVPIVNVFGFNRQTRYLPDRRDLNRCFPGSATGSLAGQFAHILTSEIVAKATHGIDLHTGANHRTNLPQIRGCLDDPATAKLANAFNVPVIINSSLRDGSLRAVAMDRGIPMLVFEGGQAHRFEDKVIRTGLAGVLAVMETIGMLTPQAHKPLAEDHDMHVARFTKWVRAPQSGCLRIHKHSGAAVKKGDRLGTISDPFGHNKETVYANISGIIIGQSLLPLVNNGDALFHIAGFDDSDAVIDSIDLYDASLGVDQSPA